VVAAGTRIAINRIVDQRGGRPGDVDGSAAALIRRMHARRSVAGNHVVHDRGIATRADIDPRSGPVV